MLNIALIFVVKFNRGSALSKKGLVLNLNSRVLDSADVFLSVRPDDRLSNFQLNVNGYIKCIGSRI